MPGRKLRKVIEVESEVESVESDDHESVSDVTSEASVISLDDDSEDDVSEGEESSEGDEVDEEDSPRMKLDRLKDFKYTSSNGENAPRGRRLRKAKDAAVSVSMKAPRKSSLASIQSQKTQSRRRTKYEEVDSEESDLVATSDENEYSERSEDEDDGLLVPDKILGRKIVSEGHKTRPMLYVKWKQQSYYHATWKDLEEVKAMRPTLVTYFLRKEAERKLPDAYYKKKEYFDPNFIVPERIIASGFEKDDDGEEVEIFLVKWMSLDYAECTWEHKNVIVTLEKEHLINEFENRSKPPKKRTSQVSEKFVPFLESPKFKGEYALRPYQVEGLNWLAESWRSKRSTILADEMGLGKTIQALALLWYLREYAAIEGPFLVIAPLSTITQWKREVSSWTDMNVVVYHGDEISRTVIRDYEFYFEDTEIAKFNVLVMSYETVINDFNFLNEFELECMVVDEAHRLKSLKSRLSDVLRQFKCKHKVMLTGTPLQNNIEEMFNLLNFLDPSLFANFSAFQEKTGNLDSSTQIENLHLILKPFLLRRMKCDVTQLAPKEEIVIEVEMTNLQKKYYKAVFERNAGVLMGKGSKTLVQLQNLQMQLRKICNHPFTIPDIECEEVPAESSDQEQLEQLISASGKTILLDKLLPKLKADGHRVLIFSQFVLILDILEDFLRFRDFQYERFDGNVQGNERQKAIDRFSSEGSDKFIFLLSTRAGGVGINLTAADTVIIFDSDWNPQQDVQAQARCHRIGQTKNVTIYRLLTRNSYEMQMFETASRKLGLDKAVLGTMGDENSKSKNKPTKAEIDALLKYGAYHIFQNDDDKSAEHFAEQNIDSILRNSTRKIHDSSQSDKGSMFSKASFVSSEADIAVDINDPDFWKKMGLQQKSKKEVLHKSDRRGRRGRNSATDFDELDATDDDEFEVPGTQQDSDSEDDEAALGDWSKSDRDLFVEQSVLYGRRKWDTAEATVIEDLTLCDSQKESGVQDTASASAIEGLMADVLNEPSTDMSKDSAYPMEGVQDLTGEDSQKVLDDGLQYTEFDPVADLKERKSRFDLLRFYAEFIICLFRRGDTNLGRIKFLAEMWDFFCQWLDFPHLDVANAERDRLLEIIWNIEVDSSLCSNTFQATMKKNARSWLLQLERMETLTNYFALPESQSPAELAPIVKSAPSSTIPSQNWNHLTDHSLISYVFQHTESDIDACIKAVCWDRSRYSTLPDSKKVFKRLRSVITCLQKWMALKKALLWTQRRIDRMIDYCSTYPADFNRKQKDSILKFKQHCGISQMSNSDFLPVVSNFLRIAQNGTTESSELFGRFPGFDPKSPFTYQSEQVGLVMQRQALFCKTQTVLEAVAAAPRWIESVKLKDSSVIGDLSAVDVLDFLADVFNKGFGNCKAFYEDYASVACSDDSRVKHSVNEKFRQIVEAIDQVRIEEKKQSKARASVRRAKAAQASIAVTPSSEESKITNSPKVNEIPKKDIVPPKPLSSVPSIKKEKPAELPKVNVTSTAKPSSPKLPLSELCKSSNSPGLKRKRYLGSKKRASDGNKSILDFFKRKDDLVDPSEFESPSKVIKVEDESNENNAE